MDHNIHCEHTLHSATTSTSLSSTTNVAPTSANRHTFQSPSSSLGDQPVSRCVASGIQELVLPNSVRSKLRESKVSSEHNNAAPESSHEVDSALLIVALDAPTPVAKSNHLVEIDPGINTIVDVDHTISHQDKAASTPATNRIGAHNIERDHHRLSSSHQANSSPTATRRINIVDYQSLQENTFPPLHPPTIVQFHQEALASASSLRGHWKYGSHDTRAELAPRLRSKSASNQKNSSLKRSSPFEAQSLRKPALRSTPPLLDPSIRTRDFFHEPVLSPICNRELASFNNEDEKLHAASPPEVILRRSSLKSLTFRPSLHGPRKLRIYRSTSISSASSGSTIRLPRYLGNHPSGISQLGRSISLEIPALNAHFVPRRARSLPRVAEYRWALPPPDPETLYISSRVSDFHLEAPDTHLKVRRRPDSSGRTPKTPEYTPGGKGFGHLRHSAEGSSVMVQRDSDETEPDYRKQFLCVPPDPEHGLWCRMKKKVGGYLDKLAGKPDDG